MKRWTAVNSLTWFIFGGFAAAGFVALAAIATLAIFGLAAQQRKMVITVKPAPVQDGVSIGKDIAPFDDTDLRLSKVVVLDSDNAYFDLTKLNDVVDEPTDARQTVLDMIAGKTWDAKLAQDLITRNADGFAIFSAAAQKPKFQNPAFADLENFNPEEMIPTPMSSWRAMARLSAVRALALAKQGKDKEAVEEALNSARIGQKIQESQAATVEFLVAMALKQVGLETVQKIFAASNFSSNDLRAYVQSLDQYYNNEDGLIITYKAEYQTMLWGIDDMVREIAKGRNEELPIFEEEVWVNKFWARRNYYFQPNKTKLLFAEWARENIRSVEKPCGDIYAAYQQLPTFPRTEELLLVENAVGEMIFNLGSISLRGVTIRKCDDDLLVAATQVLLAIKAFKTDTGNYPATLEALVPRYLPAVPPDPFDGKALKYSAAKKLIYSVGRDSQDAGGSTGDQWGEMPDPTFTISF